MFAYIQRQQAPPPPVSQYPSQAVSQGAVKPASTSLRVQEQKQPESKKPASRPSRSKKASSSEVDFDVYMALTKGGDYIEKQYARYSEARRLRQRNVDIESLNVKNMPKGLKSTNAPVGKQIVKEGADDDIAAESMAVKGEVPTQSGVKTAPPVPVEDKIEQPDSDTLQDDEFGKGEKGAVAAAEAPVMKEAPVRETYGAIGLPNMSKLFSMA